MMPDNLLPNAFVSLDLVGVAVVGGVEPVVVVATAIGYCARARLSDNCCSKSDPATTDPDCAIGSEVTSLYCPFFFFFVFLFFLTIAGESWPDSIDKNDRASLRFPRVLGYSRRNGRRRTLKERNEGNHSSLFSLSLSLFRPQRSRQHYNQTTIFFLHNIITTVIMRHFRGART